MLQVEDSPKIATIILAAGESKRMKGIKQLLPWKNSTLLENAIEQSKLSLSEDVFVILGAHKKNILNTIDTKGITIIDNPNWHLGMGTSIRAALQYFNKKKLDYGAVLILLSDQPLLDFNHYNNLIYKYIKNNKIITSSYSKGFGVPAILGKSYFERLMNLQNDQGAKKVIMNHLSDMIIVHSKNKTIDLDTRTEYQKYYNQYGKL